MIAKYGDYDETPFTTGSKVQLPICRLDKGHYSNY